MNVCILNLSAENLDDNQLNELLNGTPPRSIILLEDIDAAFSDRTAAHSNNVTFSGLLNALGNKTNMNK